MKLFVFAAIVAVAVADQRPAPQYGAPAPAPQSYSAPAPAPKYGPAPKIIEILSQEFELRDDQSYDQSFETENGISASESGAPVAAAGYDAEPSYAVQGQFSYKDDYGQTYTVTYVADDNGFQPQGDHLPTPVPTEYPTPEVSDEEPQSYSAPAAAAPARQYAEPAPAPQYPRYPSY